METQHTWWNRRLLLNGLNRTRGFWATILMGLLVVTAMVTASLEAAPVRGGTLRVALTAEPPGLDPSVSTSQEIARMVYNNLYEGLVKIDRDGRIVPALAREWEVSPDAMTYTFYLREGVRFHDGTPFTSADVTAKFQRALDPHSGHTNTHYYRSIQTVEAPDEYTVVFHLSEPDAELLYNLARPDSVIAPAGRYESQRTHPIGTGPFRFVEWVRGSHVRLERFEDYYDPELPYLDAVIFRFMPDPSAQLAALLANDLDVIAYGLSPENALLLKSTPGYRVIEGSTTGTVVMAMNNSRPPLNDRRVRLALTHAVNKQELIDGAMFGFGVPLGSHMTPAEDYYVDLSQRYPYDPQRARELLAEAGYAEGLQLTLSLPQPYEYARRSGELVAAQLARVGVDVRLEVVEWATWLSRIFGAADYDLTIIGHAEPFDIGIYANPNYYFRYNGKRVQELIAQARRTADEEARRQLYRQVQEVIADDAVNVFLFALPYLVAVRDDVQNWWPHQPTVAVDVTAVYRQR